MYRILTVILILMAATAVAYAAPEATNPTPDGAAPSLSLQSESALYHPTEFSLERNLSAQLNQANPGYHWPEYKGAVNYDFESWFKSNSTTIAIVAVAIVLLIIIAD